MLAINNWHPITRYGVAAAYIRHAQQNLDFQDRQQLWALAKVAITDLLNSLILQPASGGTGQQMDYKYLGSHNFKSRKNAANGYFTAPHVLTGNNVADIIKETGNLLVKLNGKDEGKNYELKRSFAPLIAKFNAGKKSMSNPKVDILEAAYTCIGAITFLKPAAFIKDISDNFGNAGVIPDLPLLEGEEMPLIEFVELFREMASQGVKDGFSGKITKEKKFPRPKVFYGNYPDAPQTFGLGAVSLVAAIGKWAAEHQDQFDESQRVLQLLEERPIYIVSYIGSHQEKYGHHITKLALSGALHRLLKSLPKVELTGVDNSTKFSDPKWKLFIRYLDQFLRFFNASSWRNFLAHRATYPSEFFQLLKSYFMQTGKYTEELMDSAVAYGQSLNRAAYIAATQEVSADEKQDRSGRSINEYKHRVLLQLESIISSSESGSELAARLNAQVGRLTMQDIHSQGRQFLKEVANEVISLEDAKHLVTAFMRLSTYDPNKNNNSGEINLDDLP